MANFFIANLQLVRVRQYYKNVILFFGVFFAGKLFDFNLYPKLIIAFILVSLCSSLTYIINDINDIESDKIHPEKLKNRPLANGDLSKTYAWILFVIIFAVIVYSVVVYLNMFSLMLVFIFVNGLIYNFIFKKYAFADIIGISTIYIWRALAGCAIIDVRISPWLIITVFLTALLLATGKRIADLQLLGDENAKIHKSSYDTYSKDLLENILIIVASSLFIIFTLYCVLGPQEDDSIVPLNNQGLLVYITPIVLYLIIRFIYLVKASPKIVRSSEKLFFDKGMIIGGITLGFSTLAVLYIELGSLKQLFQLFK